MLYEKHDIRAGGATVPLFTYLLDNSRKSTRAGNGL
jgi:hypothetical protein